MKGKMTGNAILQPTRRDFLALGAGASAAALLSHNNAWAQESVLRVMGADTDEVDIAWYKQANADFEADHPGTRVQYDYVNSASSFQKITTLLAANDVPDVFGGQGIAAVSSFWNVGVLEPLNDVVDALGKDDFFPSTLDLYTVDGKVMGVPVERTSFVLWYRKDLAERENVKPPVTWDDYLAYAKATTRDGMYGVAIPCGMNPASGLRLFEFFRQNNGNIVDEDLVPAVDSQANHETLEFIRELYQYSPPGSPGYGYGEMLSAYITGAVASSIYSGRMLQRASSRNPEIAPFIGAVGLPYKAKPFGFADVRGAFVFAGARNKEAAKDWILKYRAGGKRHIDWLLTAPGNNLPVRQSAASDPLFADFPMIKEHPDIFATLYNAADIGGNLYKESANHKPNPKAGALSEGPLLPTMLQRFLVNGEKASDVLAWGQSQVKDMMADI
ncbi:ABC transporter substrate-binding protein [Shinella sp. BYT-45]|uniref:ABC transporter substrate-binding protein n=1 Tax=Shinella sp. BYT-45 TaxID=3377377 RepID=UPI00397FF49C